MARKGALAGVREQDSRTIGEVVRLVVEGRELLPVTDRLLEVVADDLVELTGSPELGLSGPSRKPLVQLRAALLGDAGIRGVPDQGVAKTVGILAARPRREEILPRETE